MDFLLKREQIVLEAKMTRLALKDREVYDELVQDAVRYREHSDCKTLLCLIYDPTGLLKNPRGLESDVQKLSTATLQVKAVVIP
jgi:hypothetical protein